MYKLIRYHGFNNKTKIIKHCNYTVLQKSGHNEKKKHYLTRLHDATY